jgi:hypothetical protein
MTSTAVHIADMLEAIRTGVVPGAFNEDRTVFEFPVLAYVGTRGATHLWTLRVRLLREGSDAYVPIEDEMLAAPAVDLDGYTAEIVVETQQVAGKVRDVVPTYVDRGKNLGPPRKKNATNALTQALRDALGLYNKHKKRADIVEAPKEEPAPVAKRGPTPKERPAPVTEKDGEAPAARAWSAVEARAAAEAEEDANRGDAEDAFDPMPPPMLVKKIGETREATLTPADFENGVIAQRKFDGVHYVAFARTGPGGRRRLIRYSRTGSEYPGQEQIAAELLPMIEAAPQIRAGEYGTPAAPATEADQRVLGAYGALPGSPGDPAPYFAGELYLHGKSINWISGQARKENDEGQLQFWVFDVFFPHAKAAGHDMVSRDRQAYLAAFFAAADAAGLKHPHVVPVENFSVHSLGELEALAKRFLREHYEGAIARKDLGVYQYGYSNYHSSSLVKIKPRPDAEFPVVGFTQGKRGKEVGAVIWECEVPHPVNPRDKTFSVVPEGMSYPDRYRLFECLGQRVNDSSGREVSRFERDFKGLPLTCSYASISSKTGKPLQAKASLFRTFESGPDVDPVKKALAECGL